MSETPDETQQDETQEQDGPGDVPAGEPTPEEEQQGAEEELEQQEHEGEPETPDEGTPEGQPEGRALSQKDIEGRLDKLNREGERHFKRVAEIMDESMMDLTPCELCWQYAPGFRFTMIPDDQRATAMLALGMSDVGNYADDAHSEACADCRGWGVVATGSKVSGQESLTCMNCNGRGWMGDRAMTVALAPAPLAAVETPNGVTVGVPQSPEVAEAKRAAEALGLIVIDTHAPATT